MKIGIILRYERGYPDSLNIVYGSTLEVLEEEHELVYFPQEYPYCSKARQREILQEMILSCDVLVGAMDTLTLQVRRDLNKEIPFICFLLGNMPRGAINMMKRHHLFSTTDILLGNCAGDMEILDNFFENAQSRLLPFSFNENDFYPLDEAAKRDIRARLGFGPEERILLYSGRLALEKNVHTTLRVFSLVQKLVPNTRLIIAGEGFIDAFLEFGSFSLSVRNTLERLVAKLGIDRNSVTFAGSKDKAELLELYNIADLLINMTLHHDENFGLAQVEAMACGTPVVGANWGGLKDTIVEGETGYKVSTAVTDSGVKLNWWEAVNKIVSLLNDGSKAQWMSRKCRDRAHSKYSLTQYRQNLKSILDDCRDRAGGRSEPLRASEFARQFWDSCAPVWGAGVAYKHGVSSYRMYKELITPYAGTSSNGECAGRRLRPDHELCLAAPLVSSDEGSYEINDPIYPLKITIPPEHRVAVNRVIDVLRDEPVITVERLTAGLLAGQAGVSDAVEWMIDAGLILKTEPEIGHLPPRVIGGHMGLPLFSIQSISSSTDIVVVR